MHLENQNDLMLQILKQLRESDANASRIKKVICDHSETLKPGDVENQMF